MHIHTIQLNIEKLMGGTAHMDATEFGAYMLLIIACYRTNNKLPKDDKRLARIAKISLYQWGKIKDVILEKFTEESTHYSQNFVKKELIRFDKLSKKNKAIALKRHKTDLPVVHQKSTNINNYNLITNNSKKKYIKKKNGLSDLKIDDIQTWLEQKRVSGKYLDIDEHALLERFKNYCESNGKTYKDYTAAFRNAFEWNNPPKIKNYDKIPDVYKQSQELGGEW